MARLPRFMAGRGRPWERRTSAGRSITMTSAPISASIMPAKGPGPIPANSMTRSPCKGPVSRLPEDKWGMVMVWCV